MIENNYLTELKSIRDLIRYSVTSFNKENLFFGHGSENSLDESIYLISYLLKISPEMIDYFIDSRITNQERYDFLQIIKKRIETRLPASYLTNESWLQGYKFYVDNRVIIPRSFISEIIINGLDPWLKDRSSVKNILDLCTGSACLAIISSFIFQNAKILATDISDDALEVAKKNIDYYNLQDRIFTKKSNIFEKIEPYKYDIILCNPPYVNKDSMEKLPEEYRHEPKIALDGGEDGMFVIRSIIKNYSKFLNKNGILILEIGNEYENFKKAFPKLEPIWLTTANTEKSVLLLKKNKDISNSIWPH